MIVIIVISLFNEYTKYDEWNIFSIIDEYKKKIQDFFIDYLWKIININLIEYIEMLNANALDVIIEKFNLYIIEISSIFISSFHFIIQSLYHEYIYYSLYYIINMINIKLFLYRLRLYLIFLWVLFMILHFQIMTSRSFWKYKVNIKRKFR